MKIKLILFSDREAFVNELLRDSIGSRIIETIIRISSNEIVQLIWDTYFNDKDKLAELCKHPAGNFAVQRMFERATNSEDISSAIDPILANAMDLICNLTLPFERANIRFVADICRDSSPGCLWPNKHRMSESTRSTFSNEYR